MSAAASTPLWWPNTASRAGSQRRKWNCLRPRAEKQPMRDFLLGISYLPRGFRLLWAPGLRRYVGWPIAINVVVFILLFWFAGAQFQHLLSWLLPNPEAFTGPGFWQQTLRYATLTLYWLLWP